MLWNASAINGYAIAASDGRLGTVSDFLFDDASWLVRWLVVDTGNWLSGRKVLLPPVVLGHLDPTTTRIPGQIDHAAGQGQPGHRHRSAGVAADGDQCLRLLRLEPVLGHRPLHGRLRLYGRRHGRRHRRHGIQAARREIRRHTQRTTAIRICAASRRSPDTISMPATARSVTSRTSLWMIPIGASITSSSIRRTGGPARRS